MNIETIPCGFDNYAYLISCSTTCKAAVVDPVEPFPIWQAVEGLGVELVAVLCTHHHGDHTGGIQELLEEQPELLVYGFHSEAGRIPGLNVKLSDGERVRIGELEGRVMHTPGHTDGSVCYHFTETLFTGDTVFGAGCGRMFEGTPEQLHHSLVKIAALPDTTRIYFGHEYTEKNLRFALEVEPANQALLSRLEQVSGLRALGRYSTPSTVGEELATNPFFRCGKNSVRAIMPDGNLLTDSEVFARLRALRDRY